MKQRIYWNFFRCTFSAFTILLRRTSIFFTPAPSPFCSISWIIFYEQQKRKNFMKSYVGRSRSLFSFQVFCVSLNQNFYTQLILCIVFRTNWVKVTFVPPPVFFTTILPRFDNSWTTICNSAWEVFYLLHGFRWRDINIPNAHCSLWAVVNSDMNQPEEMVCNQNFD